MVQLLDDAQEGHRVVHEVLGLGWLTAYYASEHVHVKRYIRNLRVLDLSQDVPLLLLIRRVRP